jgi:hypothetical protein
MTVLQKEFMVVVVGVDDAFLDQHSALMKDCSRK